jgi:hypothetical protein
MDYLSILQEALKKVVVFILSDVAKNGLQGSHHFYITFKTHYPGVILSKDLKEQFSDMITIVMQNDFENLVVYENYFEVNLSFGGVYQKVKVPFDSIIRFEDPSEPFALDFIVLEKEGEDEEDENIIRLDSFRK